MPGRSSTRVYRSNQWGSNGLIGINIYGFKGEIRKCISILFPKHYPLHTWLHLPLDTRESTTSVWKDHGKNRILRKLTAINHTVSERILVTRGSMCWQWKCKGNAVSGLVRRAAQGRGQRTQCLLPVGCFTGNSAFNFTVFVMKDPGFSQMLFFVCPLGLSCGFCLLFY